MKRTSGFYMLYYRELRRILRVVKQTVFTPLINTSLYLLIFGVSLGKSIEMQMGMPYLLFLIPGLVMMGCLNNSFQNSASSVTNSKFNGELQDFRVVPLGFSEIVWAYALGGLTRGFVIGSLIYAVGALFYRYYFGSFFAIAHPLLLLAFLVIGSLLFAMLGIAVAFWTDSFEQLSAISNFVLLPLMYLGGVFYSIASLDSFWQAVSRLNPLFYLINGVRFGMLGKSDVEPYFALGMSAASLLILYGLAWWCVKKGNYQRF